MELEEIGKYFNGLYGDFYKRSFVQHTDIRRLVYEKTNGRCAYCGEPFSDGWHKTFHVDHIRPWSKYHDNRPDNLLPCCGNCNIKKKDKDIKEWHELFKKEYGREYFFFETLFTRLELRKEFDEHLEETGYGCLGIADEFEDKPRFEANTICCGKINNLVDLVLAFPKLTKLFPIKENTFKEICDFLKSVYTSCKTKYPSQIPEIIFK